jgi:hypothetical protein
VDLLQWIEMHAMRDVALLTPRLRKEQFAANPSGLARSLADTALALRLPPPHLHVAGVASSAGTHTSQAGLRPAVHGHRRHTARAGGLSGDGQRWIDPKHRRFLVPCRVLSVVFRGLVKRGLKRAALLAKSNMRLWRKPWVVHAQPAGRADNVLDYLARGRPARQRARLDL